jgi:hypothetical protein
MRTGLFLSSLFAASLVTGAALADNHHPIEFGRAHGDTYEKTYKVVESSHAGGSVDHNAATGGSKSPLQAKANERVNCSQEGADCAASHGSAARAGSSAGSPSAKSSKAMPAAIAGKSSSRESCDEAGEGCEMSSKAAKSMGSKGHGANDPTEATPMAQSAMAAIDRKMNQAYGARMSCNEGDECSMSSKDAAKIWRTEAFKAGGDGMSSKALDFSNAHASLKARMEAARFRSNTEHSKR